jgi:hypothetical protein
MTKLAESAELLALGELIDLGEQSFRADAVLRADSRSFVARFLSKGEALFPSERGLLSPLLEAINPGVSLFIGHAEASLPPPDEAAIRRLAPGRVIIERLEV